MSATAIPAPIPTPTLSLIAPEIAPIQGGHNQQSGSGVVSELQGCSFYRFTVQQYALFVHYSDQKQNQQKAAGHSCISEYQFSIKLQYEFVGGHISKTFHWKRYKL